MLNRSGHRQQAGNALEVAVAGLREKALSVAEGEFLGSEEDLQNTIGVARLTLRQAARLLEKEGILRVRRGPNGGYFSARPSIDVVETAVSAYLRANGIAVSELVTIASLLWPEVLRLAVHSRHPDFAAKVDRLQATLDSFGTELDPARIAEAEAAISERIFELADSRYIELIFRVNRSIANQMEIAGSLNDKTLLADWLRDKALEIQALRTRDEELAIFAAHRSRRFFDLWVQARQA